jgi:hypothetical protein
MSEGSPGKENEANPRRESILSSFDECDITEGPTHRIPHMQKNITVSKQLQEI